MKIYDKSGRSIFEGKDLRGADLRHADLECSSLGGVDLGYANLEGANLEGADLRHANLFRANLEGANLEGANLGGANLVESNLMGANLDYSSGIPLWCGGQGAYVDDKQARQIVAHALSMHCDSQWYQDLQGMAREACQQSHIAKHLDWLTEKDAEK